MWLGGVWCGGGVVVSHTRTLFMPSEHVQLPGVRPILIHSISVLLLIYLQLQLPITFWPITDTDMANRSISLLIEVYQYRLTVYQSKPKLIQIYSSIHSSFSWSALSEQKLKLCSQIISCLPLTKISKSSVNHPCLFQPN